MKTPHFYFGVCKGLKLNQGAKYIELKRICIVVYHLWHTSLKDIVTKAIVH